MKIFETLLLFAVLLNSCRGLRYLLGAISSPYRWYHNPQSPQSPKKGSSSSGDVFVDPFDIMDSDRDGVIDLYDFNKFHEGRAIDKVYTPRQKLAVAQLIEEGQNKEKLKAQEFPLLDLSALTGGANFDKYTLYGCFRITYDQAKIILGDKSSISPADLAEFFRGTKKFN